MKKRWHRYLAPLRDLARLIVPDSCCGCGKPLQGDERDLCTHCLLNLPLTHYAPVVGNGTELRVMGQTPIVAATSLLYFRSDTISQHIVHSIKYYNHASLGYRMGLLIGREMLASKRFDGIDLIVPVPLHRKKLRSRGYNQSLQLARGISQQLHKPIADGNLYRTRYTDSQTRKNRQDRHDNISDAFALHNPDAFADKHILLVDDVITSGATVVSCADALHQAPNLKLSVASLAVTYK